MASIGTGIDLIGQLLDNNGHYMNDPQAFELSSYLNNGVTTFHIAYSERDLTALYQSPFCHKIKRLWDRNGITSYGQEVLDKYLSPRKY